ncbi:MAG: hypothetical protein K8S27_07845 [Candidatus Omnitrophica bacterium]|nr:hypothetical protein [Candidatus Omnitrophota bacterium]
MDLKGTVVFSSGKIGKYEIWSIDLETKDLKQLTYDDCCNTFPKWSPDGSKIVYVSDASGTPEIWSMKADGSDQQRLTKEDKWHDTPAWSPAGKEIVFSANYDGPINVYTMKSDGSDRKRVTAAETTDYTPQFSADGSKIVFTSKRGGTPDIWMYEVDTKEAQKLTDFDGRDFAPSFSPDGQTIAYISGVPNDQGKEDLEIFLMNADGSDSRQVIRQAGTDRYVAWSPDGRYLIFASSKGGSSAERLTVADLQDKKVKILKWDRDQFVRELDNLPKGYGLFKFLPESMTSLFYPASFFGLDKHPHWKY